MPTLPYTRPLRTLRWQAAALTFFQVEMMKELVDRGLSLNEKNARWVAASAESLPTRGEYPIHLASGAQGSHGDIRHVELLLQHGSNLKKQRTDEGCTAAHFAAKTGPVEVISF